ncbi:hypothetical protein HMPREF0577_1127 [Mobiluncus mulieris ATCC 35243]|nr:hypothetical protein HMPREF0577_1127 [Mobiluncus mulieris ATCC 35243]
MHILKFLYLRIYTHQQDLVQNLLHVHAHYGRFTGTKKEGDT